jgi:hypothetical protein
MNGSADRGGNAVEKMDRLTKALAVTGTVLVWLPLLAPLAFAVLFFFERASFGFDYLMPAELFLVVLLGSAVLFWAALRAHSYVRLVGGGFILAVIVLVAGQWIAVATGLASGETPPTGWRWGLVIGSLAIYWLGLIVVGTGGVLLVRDLLGRSKRLGKAI